MIRRVVIMRERSRRRRAVSLPERWGEFARDSNFHFLLSTDRVEKRKTVGNPEALNPTTLDTSGPSGPADLGFDHYRRLPVLPAPKPIGEAL